MHRADDPRVSRPSLIARFAAVVPICCAAAAMGQATGDGVAREAIGPRAERLAAMELEPFDEELWAALDGWTSDPLTASSTGGKVVLIGSWASWNATSTRALAAMDRLAKQHADDGLVVLGLHHETGWDNAQASAARVSFPVAHDADGAWRSALEIDQDPDFYLIDRAGQLRYADIHTSSLSKAVSTLLDESAGDASSVKNRLAEAAERAEIDFRRTRALERDAAIDIPEVSFAMPGPEAYSEVDWPESAEMKKADRGNRGRGSDEWVPEKFTLPADKLYPPGPVRSNGKLLVVYFWNHEIEGRGREFMRDAVERINLFSRRYQRDVTTIGLLTTVGDDRNRNRRDDDEDEWKPEELKTVVEQMHRTFALNHKLFIDDPDFGNRGILTSPVTRGQRSSSRDTILWPFAAIVTTDGSVRWAGFIGEEFRQIDDFAGYDEFILALERMIDRDPGVQARREAEDAFIRGRGR